MGSTYYFALPYPQPEASVDVPRDVKVLAENVDNILQSKFVQYGADGQVSIVSGGVARPVPFAHQCGQAGVWFDQAFVAYVAVTFAAGRFTRPPIVLGTGNNPSMFATTQNQSANGFLFYLFHGNQAVPVTGSFFGFWMAVQSTASGAALLDVRSEETIPVQLTCAVEGCENAGIPLVLDVDPVETLRGMCGVCGTDITDIVPL
jgi:hypothetical protein